MEFGSACDKRCCDCFVFLEANLWQFLLFLLYLGSREYNLQTWFSFQLVCICLY